MRENKHTHTHTATIPMTSTMTATMSTTATQALAVEKHSLLFFFFLYKFFFLVVTINFITSKTVKIHCIQIGCRFVGTQFHTTEPTERKRKTSLFDFIYLFIFPSMKSRRNAFHFVFLHINFNVLFTSRLLLETNKNKNS